jgi:putative tryptophan/tyrosine transport system substrate-binding protein
MTPCPAPTRRLVLAAAGMFLLPLGAGAQSAKRRRIALLFTTSREYSEPYLATFRQGLRALGYGDGDIEIVIRYADGHPGRLPDLAAELVQTAPTVFVAAAIAAVRAAQQATSTIPIVMLTAGDPVASGLVDSLAHPGGNLTGLTSIASYEIAGKWLQLLKTAIPAARRVAILLNPTNSQHPPEFSVARHAAQTLRVELLSVEARAIEEIDGAFAAVAREHAQALIVPGDPMFLSERSQIVGLAGSHKLPAIYGFRDFAVAGGLMSYGIDLEDLYRRGGSYVDKILRGAKPADLPVEQPTKFQLVVNLKTARTLGLTIPPTILAGADEVIE